MRMRPVHVDATRRFALEIDDETGRAYLSIPVSNRTADYEEWYEIGLGTLERFVADPDLALPMVEQARRREIDHLLLLPPGADRGTPS